MSLHLVTDASQLDATLDGAAGLVIIGFFGSFSALSDQARPAFEAFAAAQEGPVLLVDVGQVKGLHSRFGVDRVPAAVAVEEGRVIRRAQGNHDAEGWERALLPHEGAVLVAADGSRGPSVTVYTSPTCVWCDRVKSWLREQAVPFREIDVARDPGAAEALVARSGQMGVPQIEVGHEIVVGFDKPRLQRLLGLQAA